jgi:hypothetical protein
MENSLLLMRSGISTASAAEQLSCMLILDMTTILILVNIFYVGGTVNVGESSVSSERSGRS